MADYVKCFKHVQGAAQILLRCSNPKRQCEKILGRQLLRWYTGLEYHCCMMLGCKTLLPQAWRLEDSRVRKELARLEYPNLPKSQRKQRLVDDIFQEVASLNPYIVSMYSTIVTLKGLRGETRSQTLLKFREELIFVRHRLKEIMESSLASEVLETEKRLTYTSKHSECCPDPPAFSYKFRFPPAGMLQLSFLVLLNGLQIFLYAPIRQAGIRIAEFEDDASKVQSRTYEICCVFAAIEDEFDDLNVLLPAFNNLIMAGFSCPKNLRSWLWHKLAHFEQFGHLYFEPLKRKLSVLWGMPELLEMGFASCKESPLENRKEELGADDLDLVSRFTNLDLNSDDAENAVRK